MAIKNIQALQYNHDVFEQDEKEQYIQALANAGQRIGVKGDSITLDKLSFLDILKENANFADIDIENAKKDYIGKLNYSLDFNGIPQCNFSILSKNDFANGKFDNILHKYTVNYKDIFNIYNNTDKFSFDIQLNNYSFIKENSMFKLDSNHFTSVIFAKIIGSDELTNVNDSSKYNLELHYDKYNTITNKLDDAIRIFHINGLDEPEFALLYFKRETTSSSNANPDDVYSLDVWHLVISATRPMDIQTFENYLCDSADSNRNKYDVFSLLESFDISDVDNLFKNSSNVETIFSYFINRGTKINPSTEILVCYNEHYANGYEFMSRGTDGKYYKIDRPDEFTDSLFSSCNYLKDKHDITINDRIYFLSNDIAMLYPRLLEKYCNDVFFSSTSSLAKQIFCRLYESILLEYSNSTNISINESYSVFDILTKLPDDENAISMYVPLNYDLQYYCNSQNHNQIYNSNSIYVSFVNNLHGMVSNKLLKLVDNTNSSTSNIIIDYNDVDKTSIYQFTFDYNNDLNNTSLSIKSLSLLKLHTLPYIDKSTSCWVINDTITNFKTISDAVSPQMILITYNTFDKKSNTYHYTLLNGLSNDMEDMFNVSNSGNEIVKWVATSCHFGTNLLVGNSSESIKSAIESKSINETTEKIKSITAKCLVPHIRIDSNLVPTFENTLLFTIFDYSTFEDSVPEKFKSGLSLTNIYNSYIFSTIWKLNKDEIIVDENDANIKYYAFDYIRAQNTNLDNTQYDDYAFDASILFNNNIAAVRQSLSNLNLFESIVFYNSSQIDAYKDNYQNDQKLLAMYSPRVSDYLAAIKKVNDYEISEDSFKNNYILSIQAHKIDFDSIQNKIFSLDQINYDKTDNYFIRLGSDGNTNISICNLFYKKTLTTNDSIDNTSQQITSNNNSEYNVSESLTLNTEYVQNISLSNSLNKVTKSSISNNVISNYDEENVFANEVPLLDLKEILILNSTSLNRLNFIYPEKNYIYNAFLGLPINDDLNQAFIYDRTTISNNGFVPKHNIVELTSSSTNINMGNEYLISQNDKNNFKESETFYLKFDNVVVEADNIYHKVKKYTDIITGGGLIANFASEIDSKVTEVSQDVIIKSSNPETTVNANNIIDSTNVELSSIIVNANNLQFGLNDKDSVNDPSNVILFNKEINPVGVVLEYSSLPQSEMRSFGNAFNVLWYGDKDRYSTSESSWEVDKNLFYNLDYQNHFDDYLNDPIRTSKLIRTQVPYSVYGTNQPMTFGQYYYEYLAYAIDDISYMESNLSYFNDLLHYYFYDDKSIHQMDTDAYIYKWLKKNNIINVKYENTYEEFHKDKRLYFYTHGNTPLTITKLVVNNVKTIRCGLEAFSKYYYANSTEDEIIPKIFKLDTDSTYAQNIKVSNILRELNYIDSAGNLISKDNMSITAFFIKKLNPDDLWDSIYNNAFNHVNDDGNVTHSSESQILRDFYDQSNAKEFIDKYRSNSIYIFRLSDYLYAQYGLDITHENEFFFDEEFSVENKIFRIALNPNIDGNYKNNNNDPCYAYFLIYYKDDLTIRKFRYSTNDVFINTTLNLIDSLNNNDSDINKDDYNINYYEIAYPKRPIQLIKRKIVHYHPTEIISNSNANESIFSPNTEYVYNILF